MKLVIAEAGGTKTDWRIVENEHIRCIGAAGLNYQHLPQDLFRDRLQEAARQAGRPDRLVFYGAGMQTDEEMREVCDLLRAVFHAEEVEVYPDTLAAARALLGSRAGWFGMIGTGSALAYFDGKRVAHQRPSLGYLLGDEGSGAYLGAILLRDFLRGDMPDFALEHFRDFLKDEKNLIGQLYRHPSPNRLLAQTAGQLRFLKDSAYAQRLIKGGFDAYFDAYLKNSPDSPVSFVGSIAFHYAAELASVAEERGISVGNVIKSPIGELVGYHTG